MFKSFIGKNVEMILGFSSYTLDGGTCPGFFYGEVLDVNENTLKIALTKSGKGFGATTYNNEIMEVNIKYVIAVREV